MSLTPIWSLQPKSMKPHDKQLPEPVLTYCQLDPQWIRKHMHLKMHLRMLFEKISSIFFRFQYITCNDFAVCFTEVPGLRSQCDTSIVCMSITSYAFFRLVVRDVAVDDLLPSCLQLLQW